MLKKLGEDTLPWPSPPVVGTASDTSPLTDMRVARCANQPRMKVSSLAGTPWRSSTASMASGCTLSYAFSKSMNTMNTLRRLRHASRAASRTAHGCHSVPMPAVKAPWSAPDTAPTRAEWCVTRAVMTRSMSFASSPVMAVKR